MRALDGKNWYKPMEIAQMGLIQNSKGSKSSVSGNYNFVLGLIKSGRLRAKNYSIGGAKPYWLVPEEEVVRYHDTVTRVKK